MYYTWKGSNSAADELQLARQHTECAHIKPIIASMFLGS